MIRISKKILSEALTDIKLSGKYFVSSTSKKYEISDYATFVCGNGVVDIYNADAATGCCISIAGQSTNDVMFVSSISKMLNYIKNMEEDIAITVDDFITLSDGKSTFKYGKTLNHPTEAMIARLISFNEYLLNINLDSTVDVNDAEFIEFSNTTLEAMIHISSDTLDSAIKSCDAIGSSLYKIDIHPDGEIILSSSIHNNATEFCSVNLTSDVQVKGEPATVSFTGQVNKFFSRTDDAVFIQLKDEFPLFFVQNDRFILKAPHISVN